MNTQDSDIAVIFPDFLQLIVGSHIHGIKNLELALKYWIENRKPMIQAINRSGTFLDIGCANGLLLATTMMWSEHQIVPYGIDVELTSIIKARLLIKNYAPHFAQADLLNLNTLTILGVDCFDFVFWNVWDNFDPVDPLHIKMAQNALRAVRSGGRLILGFYSPFRQIIKSQLYGIINIVGLHTNLISGPTVFAWWDVSK